MKSRRTGFVSIPFALGFWLLVQAGSGLAGERDLPAGNNEGARNPTPDLEKKLTELTQQRTKRIEELLETRPDMKLLREEYKRANEALDYSVKCFNANLAGTDSELAGARRQLLEASKEYGKVLEKAVQVFSSDKQIQELTAQMKEVGQPVAGKVVPGAAPKPGSTPQFDTPLGYFVRVLRSGKVKIPARATENIAEAASRPIDKPASGYMEGEYNRQEDECFLGVHFYAPKGGNPGFAFGQFSIRAGGRTAGVLGFCTSVKEGVWNAVGPNVSSVKDLPGSTYLLFKVPRTATTCELCFGQNSVTVDLSRAPTLE